MADKEKTNAADFDRMVVNLENIAKVSADVDAAARLVNSAGHLAGFNPTISQENKTKLGELKRLLEDLGLMLGQDRSRVINDTFKPLKRDLEKLG